MHSDESLSLILRRLDEIERKLDRMMGATGSHCHRLFGTAWQSSKEGLKVRGEKHREYFDPTRAAKAMDRQIIDR
jgi:hypothetical protein